MPPPTTHVTPPNNIDRWKKLWGTPKRMTDAATEEAFEEFQQEFVPGHMHKMFLKRFGVPKAEFGNRFFADGTMYRPWDTTLSTLLMRKVGQVEVTVIYGSTERLEGHILKGEVRRTLRDIMIDDNDAACAIVRSEGTTLYTFIQYKVRGCIVRTVRADGTDEQEDFTE